jgi:hypothetical protein
MAEGEVNPTGRPIFTSIKYFKKWAALSEVPRASIWTAEIFLSARRFFTAVN